MRAPGGLQGLRNPAWDHLGRHFRFVLQTVVNRVGKGLTVPVCSTNLHFWGTSGVAREPHADTKLGRIVGRRERVDLGGCSGGAFLVWRIHLGRHLLNSAAAIIPRILQHRCSGDRRKG